MVTVSGRYETKGISGELIEKVCCHSVNRDNDVWYIGDSDHSYAIFRPMAAEKIAILLAIKVCIDDGD